MAKFNDLALEVQEAIWHLVLPFRGVHWIEVEGIPHEPSNVREGIDMTEWHKFDRIPESYIEVYEVAKRHPDNCRRSITKTDDSGAFFQRLFTTVPSALGKAGPQDEGTSAATFGYACNDEETTTLDDEIAYTRRCRRLSTYTQITALLSTCRLSRLIALERIHCDSTYSWPLHRSMGSMYRPRRMNTWMTQYLRGKTPPAISEDEEVIVPRIHALDLVVFRVYDSQGRATPLLRQAAWQCRIETQSHGTTFGCFDRIGIEWHPSWATAGGRAELRSKSFQAFVRLTAHEPSLLCWLVDGVPRPDWKRDYPAVVEEIFAQRMEMNKSEVVMHIHMHWGHSREESMAIIHDHHLGLEFEANGRRYYIVYVVGSGYTPEQKTQLDKAGLGYRGPFPGSADMWPEALREPVRCAYDMISDESRNMGTCHHVSYILSWEPL